MSEAYERYRVSIYGDAALLRSVDVSPPFDPDPFGRPNILYTNDLILADFGAGGLAGAPDASFAVAQLSDLVGAGREGRLALN